MIFYRQQRYLSAMPVSLMLYIKLAAHLATSPTPTALRQSFIITPYWDFSFSKLVGTYPVSSESVLK
jgi:hypothetical protein